MILLPFLGVAGAILLFAIIVGVLLSASFYTVEQQERAILERFGKFRDIVDPGLHVKNPFFDRVIAKMSIRILQDFIRVETKTKDNVFVTAVVAVQRRVIAAKAADAWYQLQDPKKQIEAFVLDATRSFIPNYTLDEIFMHKDELAISVSSQLSAKMLQYGYEIVNVLVTEIDPAKDVKAAMNEIQTQSRLQIAAQSKGEANRLLLVKNAEAEAESKRLQGEGIAAQRTAIARGLKEAVATIAEASGADPKEVLMTVMLTQYLDTMKEIGVGAGSKVILLPHAPAAMNDLMAQLRAAIITAEHV
jgi:regulator of protease activity HflC (stomatin/prohibitin superfamily)